MPIVFERVLSGLLLVSLAGCAAAPAVVVPPPSASEPVPVCQATPTPVVVCEPPSRMEPPAADVAARRFFAWHDQVRQMSLADLTREIARIGDPANNPQAIVQLAVVLGQTRNTADTVRALALLDPLVRSIEPDAAPWQAIARALQSRFGEQRRVEEQLERQAGQLRDNRKQIDQLNEKLEALKALERSLNKRPDAGASSPSPSTRAASSPKTP